MSEQALMTERTPGEIRTTCPYCGVGCGLIARPGDGGWTLRGDPDHPANRGRLCSKGTALGDTLGLETRLLHPETDGRRTSWDDAVAETARRIGSVIERYGPDAFAFYLSGQLLTEDYYAANKFAKGFLGSANVDTNSRLCMASAVAGHRRAFGADVVPGCYEDLELADLVVLAGSNMAWCHPVLFQRLRKAREERGLRVVVIDPRHTETCDIADLHLAVAPGSDVALFNGLLAYCEAAGALDAGYVARHTSGFEEALAAARADAADLAARCDVPEADLARFFQQFASTARTVTAFSQGINQSASGTDKVNAIINVHLATGRIGKPGAGPFSLTGQPNAMGGREVGGLANQLAAHMGFDAASIDRVRRFWDAPRMAEREGLKAVDMFRAIGDGRIKAVWIMGANPAVSLPDAEAARRALAKCPVVIVSECSANTDTLDYAHIRLPALAWGEKDGTVTNSERMISRQRSFLPHPGEARPDWRAVADVADAMGMNAAAMGMGAAFGWRESAEIFREHAALSAFENNGERAFDIGAVAGADYDAMSPFRWGGGRRFAEGGFFTPDGRARLIAVRWRRTMEDVDDAYPIRLNTGRYRDQWHSMGRTGLSPRLSGHRPEPFCDIHRDDAAAHGIENGGLVRVESRLGDFVARARLGGGQRRGEAFLPIHWSDAFAARAVAGRLIPAHADPVSGQPELKHAAIRLSAVPTAWRGLLLGRRLPPLDGAVYWTRRTVDGTSQTGISSGDEAARNRLLAILDMAFGPERAELIDERRGIVRRAWFDDGVLTAALFLERGGFERPDDAAWTAQRIGCRLSGADRAVVLSGGSPNAGSGGAGGGPIVCACFSVRLSSITTAIREQRLTTVAEIGCALGAGTGCGSCAPELRALLSQADIGPDASNCETRLGTHA
jgi:assimilatory nitrate reductase catalytic subunit